MNKEGLRNLIKEIFKKECFLEAEETTHLSQRIKSRIQKKDLLSPEEGDEVLKNLEKLKKINFPKDKSYGILLSRIKINERSPYYVNFKGSGYYSVENDEAFSTSMGNEIWVIVRSNKSITAMLRTDHQTRDAQKNAIGLDVDNIIKNIDNFSFQRLSKKQLKKLKKQRLMQAT